jgi:hypothetical protein
MKPRNPRVLNCVSEAEAARMKGVSKEGVRQAIRRGALEVIVISPRHHLVPLDSLRSWEPNRRMTGPRKKKRATA